MFKNYLKIALRNLWKHKGFSFINVSGLAIGTAFCILTLLFIKNELSFDAYYRHQPDMYSLVTGIKNADGSTVLSAGQPADMLPLIKKEFPEIKNSSFGRWGDAIITCGDKTFNEHILFSSPDALSMFDIKLVQGNTATALSNPNGIILSLNTARKYFGNENPVGKPVRFETRKGFEQLFVTAVSGPLPETSSLQYFDCIVNYTKHEQHNNNNSNWTTMEGDIVVQLKEGTDHLQVQKRLGTFISGFNSNYELFLAQYADYRKKEGATPSYTVNLEPISSIYFNSSIRTSFFSQGTPGNIYILAGINILVLTIACINFMILSIARSANRAKEVGMRKVFGAGRVQVMKQFWGEAFLLCLVATLIGFAIAKILLPFFNELMMRNLAFSDMADGWFFSGIACVLIFIGLVAGSYPALYLSRFQPLEVFKRKLKIGGNNLATKGLIVFQFGLSILLVAVTIGILKQMDFVQTKNLQFNPANVINIRTRTGFYTDSLGSVADRFRNHAMNSPMIKNVSGIGEFSLKKFTYRGDDKQAVLIAAEPGFLTTLELKLRSGRDFIKGNTNDEQNGVIVNEAFLDQLGLDESAIGRKLSSVNDSSINHLEIIGIVRNFHLLSLKKNILPVMIRPVKDFDGILVRIQPATVSASLDFLENTWRRIAHGKPFEYQLLDRALQSDYDDDIRLKKIVEYAARFAIFLASLGLIGLVSINITNRTREIGIRKVLGASAVNVMRLLWKDFAGLVLLANFIGLPIAYIFLNNWIQNYVYRTNLSAWIFIAAGSLTVLITLTMTGIQTIKAATANPVKSLRTE